MSDSQSGEFMQTMDTFTWLLHKVFFAAAITIWLVLTVFPYFLWRNVADCWTRAVTADRVWICEHCQPIFARKIDPPFPLQEANGSDAPEQRFYACVKSVREAEDWLLARGYNKALIKTDDGAEVEFRDKEYFIRHVPGTSAYSIVGLSIDYGDYDIHQIPQRYPLGKSPADFSRFKEETFEATYGRENTVILPPGWCSTDKKGSHTFGGTCVPSWYTLERLEAYARKIAMPPKPPDYIR